MLGVPAVYIDNTGRYYTNELEKKYGLVFNFSESEEDQLKAIKKGIEILSNKLYKESIVNAHQRMLKDKIDVTSFLIWFVETFPDSFTNLKNDNKIQEKFK